MGISVVNALSAELEVTVWRQGIAYSQSFCQGAAITELREEQAAAVDMQKRGTELRFLFDSTIFSEGCASVFRTSSKKAFAAINSCHHGCTPYTSVCVVSTCISYMQVCDVHALSYGYDVKSMLAYALAG